MPPTVPNLPPKSAVANPSKTNALSPLPSKAMSTPISPKSATPFKCPLPRICANSSYKHIEKAYCQGVKHIMYPNHKRHLRPHPRASPCQHSRASPCQHSRVLVANYLNSPSHQFKRHVFSSSSFFSFSIRNLTMNKREIQLFNALSLDREENARVFKKTSVNVMPSIVD